MVIGEQIGDQCVLLLAALPGWAVGPDRFAWLPGRNCMQPLSSVESSIASQQVAVRRSSVLIQYAWS
jgi:hypothetical protein